MFYDTSTLQYNEGGYHVDLTTASGRLWLKGTGQWQEARFVLPHARFAGRSNGADFRLAAADKDLVIGSVSVRLLEK